MIHPVQSNANGTRIAVNDMRERGIDIPPGDDGFAWGPGGADSKDFEYFVDLIGITPLAAGVAGEGRAVNAERPMNSANSPSVISQTRSWSTAIL